MNVVRSRQQRAGMHGGRPPRVVCCRLLAHGVEEQLEVDAMALGLYLNVNCVRVLKLAPPDGEKRTGQGRARARGHTGKAGGVKGPSLAAPFT